jgi:uncharacterized protein involved in exopolysaccharide biosynthesis
MAKNPDILSRFADIGEEALQKLPNVPGGNRVLEMVNQTRTRMDDVQKRLRGLDVLEQRVDELEQRLATLEGAAAKKPAQKKSPATTPAAKTSAAKKPAS